MRSPASHYDEAEKLLLEAATASEPIRTELILTAQVHATLATVKWNVTDWVLGKQESQ